MDLLLEWKYDILDTNPRVSAEQKDILQAKKVRVDLGQLRGSYVCSFCNAHKGSDIAGRDERSGKLTPLFNPRRHRWHHHFRWEGALLVGATPIGRVTVALLALNDPDLVAVREALQREGRFPPAG